jgi:hypothetical protein
MKKPFVDMSLKFGAMNMSNLGIGMYAYASMIYYLCKFLARALTISFALLGDHNVSEVVISIVKDVISNMMLFPKRFVLAMTEDSFKDSSLYPDGLLRFTIVSAQDLKDSGPYHVTSTIIDNIMTTKSVPHPDPVWNEEYNILVFDYATQALECTVFSNNSFNGKLCIQINSITPNETTLLTIPLKGT